MNFKSYDCMNKAQIDELYNNTQAIDDFSEILRDFQWRSRKTYEQHNWKRDLSYGDKPRERYDFYKSDSDDAPTYIFIHGGYWSNCCKEDFSFISEGPIAKGMNVILVEYTLAPEVTMTEIVQEISRFIESVTTDRHKLDISHSPLYLAGHSAGGHLAALHRGHSNISKVHMISALVDLKPISLSWLQDSLRLTPEEIDLYSPLLNVQKGNATLVCVGANELSELRYQSTNYAVLCENKGEDVGLLHIPGATHFSILNDIADPNGCQMSLLMRM